MTIHKFNKRAILGKVLLGGILFAACSCEGPSDNESPQQEDQVRINFETSINQATMTKAAGNNFEVGDQIGFYCFESKGEPEQNILGERHYDNKLLTMKSSGLEGTTPCFYPSKYKGNSDLYFYYPYTDNSLAVNDCEALIMARQDQSSAEAFSLSDCMLATCLNTPKSLAPVKVTFKRLMSRLDFELIPGEGYSNPEDLLSAKIIVQNIYQTAVINYISGITHSPSVIKDITPHGKLTVSTEKLVGVSAIIAPQEVKAKTGLFFVQIGDKKFRGVMSKDITFVSGKRYTFTLTVNRALSGDDILIEPSIKDWVGGPGAAGETVEVDPDNDSSFATDIDGNEYPLVEIGSQTWFAKNLITTRYNDGTPITHLESAMDWINAENSETGAYCFYDNNKPLHGDTYGALYNWHCVRAQKLCPKGWKVPSAEEWIILRDYLGEKSGIKLKATSGWARYTHPSNPALDREGNGTDIYGFTARGSGRREYPGEFVSLNTFGEWWTTSVSIYGTSIQVAYVTNGYDDLKVGTAAHLKEVGHSIRCLKVK